MSERLAIEKLTTSHKRESFRCGVASLDRYLHELAGQDVRRRLANCFVAVDQASGVIAGYYTFSAASLPVADLPTEFAKRLAHYPFAPAALVGRLAVDLRYRGEGVGTMLLLDAADRAIDSAPAVLALVVDAKDDAAASFYRHFEFLPLLSKPMTLFLPISSLERRRQLDAT